MSDNITLDKRGLATIMLGCAIGSMKDLNEVERQAIYDEHISNYEKAAQDMIDKHGESEAPKIVLP